MRKLLFSICIITSFLVYSCTPIAPSKSTTTSENPSTKLQLQKGSYLVYKVQDKGQTYNINMTIGSIQPNYITYDWVIPQKEKSGKVVMVENAVLNTLNIQNTMKDGTVTLKDQSTGWVSQKLLSDLQSGKTVAVGIDNEKVVFKKKKEEVFGFGVGNNGFSHSENAIVATSLSGNKELWIVNDKTKPIIVKIVSGYTIQLVDYKKDINFK